MSWWCVYRSTMLCWHYYVYIMKYKSKCLHDEQYTSLHHVVASTSIGNMYAQHTPVLLINTVIHVLFSFSHFLATCKIGNWIKPSRSIKSNENKKNPKQIFAININIYTTKYSYFSFFVAVFSSHCQSKLWLTTCRGNV